MTRFMAAGMLVFSKMGLAAEASAHRPDPELGLEHWLLALGLGILMLLLPELTRIRRRLFLHISALDQKLH